MSFDIQLPVISAETDKGKIEQIRSYLYQLKDQLNWALSTIDSEAKKVVEQGVKDIQKENDSKTAKATFNSIKSLIISSAEVVDAYYEKLKERYAGEYVAQSDFGVYKEQTAQEITKTSTSVESLYTNMQEILTDIDSLDADRLNMTAHIKAGLLTSKEEVPVYGIEIGQFAEKNGEEIFNKYARFTSGRLSFFDKNDIEVAYISDYKLYITNAQVTGELTLGRFVLDTSNGIVCKWV